jgi:hypothetical protein
MIAILIVGSLVGTILAIFVIVVKYGLTSKQLSTDKSQPVANEIPCAPEEPAIRTEVDTIDNVKLILNPAYTQSNTRIQEDIYQIPMTSTLHRQEFQPQNKWDNKSYSNPSCEHMEDYAISKEYTFAYSGKSVPSDKKLDGMATPIINTTIRSTTEDPVYELMDLSMPHFNTADNHIPDAFGYLAIDE